MSKARLMYLAVVASLFAANAGAFFKCGGSLPFLPDGMGDGHL